jgi:hypothetical protein
MQHYYKRPGDYLQPAAQPTTFGLFEAIDRAQHMEWPWTKSTKLTID